MTLEDSRHQTVAELLAAYSLGVLEGTELRSVEEHLAEGCERCEAELAEWNHLGERLADTVTPVPPSETTRARLLSRVGGAPVSPPVAPQDNRSPSASGPAVRRIAPATWFALAASLAALAVAAWAFVRQSDLSRELAIAQQERVRLIRQQNDLRGSVAQARGQLRELTSSMELVSSPATRRIALVGQGTGEGADATALVDPNRSTALVTARGLVELPSQQTYQLWYITTADGPVSAGVFAAGPDGRALIEVSDVPYETVRTWAVTIEPVGGVPSPTGEMILKS